MQSFSYLQLSLYSRLREGKSERMKKKVIIVCSVVGFLGILSAITGFAAEATKIKSNQVQDPSSSMCVHQRSPALGLGFTAAIALLIAQIIISVMTGCICCRKNPPLSSFKWCIAIFCFIVSWVTGVIAFLTLVVAAAFNEQRSEENTDFNNCYLVRPGVFSGATVLSIVTVILGIIYYLILTSEKNINDPFRAPSVPTTQGGIAMGYPQVVPPSQNTQQDPAFVHEDTYTRRQFV